jgi:hypothetical protein
MAGWQRAIELAMGEGIWLRWKRFAARARNSASQVERARILLAYRNNLSFLAVGRTVGVHHQTAQRWVERALAYGPMASAR